MCYAPEWYRMVFVNICKHASSAYIFASTSSDQFSHASSEHFRNYTWRATSTSSEIFHQLESLFIKTMFCLFSLHLKSTLLFRTCQKQSTSQNKLPSNQRRVLEKPQNNRTFKDFSMQQHLLIYSTYKYCIFI